MGPNTDPLHGKQMVVHWQNPATGEWVALEGVSEPIHWDPLLPPGRLFGQDVEQVRPGVYEIPDRLLMLLDPDTARALDAVVSQFLDNNPGITIWRTYDPVRRITTLQLEDNNGNA